MATTKIRALTRFNNHDPGDEFEAKEADAKKWIANGVAEKAGKKPAGDDKGGDGEKGETGTKKTGSKKGNKPAGEGQDGAGGGE